MPNIFNLDDYRKYLIDYYVEEYDKNTYERRSFHIKRYYSDDYLNNIIKGTESFINYLLFELESKRINTEEFVDCKIKMPYFDELGRCRTSYISNNCIGGWSSDTIIKPSQKNNFLVSMYLLKKFLGNDFKVNIENESEESSCQHESGIIGCVYYNEILKISGRSEKLDDLYDKYHIEKPKTKNLISKKTL